MRNNTRKTNQYTANPSKYPQNKFKDKPCRNCTNLFSPIAPSHLYCCQICKDLGHANKYYQNTYKISVKDFTDLLIKQNYKCAICKGTGFKMHEGIKENLVVDHCHHSKKVRGLLCNNCNRGLGLFKDSVVSLTNAINYLK